LVEDAPTTACTPTGPGGKVREGDVRGPGEGAAGRWLEARAPATGRRDPPHDPVLERRTLGQLAASAALAAVVFVASAAPLVPALVWAGTLAAVAMPLHDRVLRRLGRPGLSAALVTLTLFVVIALPAMALGPLLMNEAAQAWRDLDAASVEARVTELGREFPTLAAPLAWVRSHLPSIEEVARAVASRVPAVVSSSAWVVMQWMVAFFAAFFLLRDGDRLSAWLQSRLPLAQGDFRRLRDRAVEVLQASVGGSLTIAAVQGVLGGLMFWFLGVPAPLLWGVIMGVLSMLPVMGAALVWVPAAVFLVLEGSWEKGLALVAWGALVVGLVDNLLYPTLVGRRLRLHTLAVFVALVGGILMFGAVGLVVGTLTLALSLEALDMLRSREGAG
jgi:predicted PurR-regulated permease PerM